MHGINVKNIFKVSGIFIIAAVLTAAIFAVLYYSGVFLPGWVRWHDVTIDNRTGSNTLDEKEPDMIELKKKRVKAYKDGRCIFSSPTGCLVQNMLYADIDRDGEKELILLDFNVGRYGSHRPFWVKRDELKLYQHIYIYDYISKDEMFRPIWMASDIGMEASDFALKDKGVIEMEDRHGMKSDWMWISFGLRCVD